MGYDIDSPFAGMPRTTEGQREQHSADGKTFILHVTTEKWEVWFAGHRVDAFVTRELARQAIRAMKRRARMLHGTLSRRITVETMCPIVRGLHQASEGMRHATYRAACVSPLLSATIARVFPMTFCPHDYCILPIAHDGDHYPDHGNVLDA